MKMKLFLITVLWFAIFYIQNLSAQNFFGTIRQYNLSFQAEDLKSGEEYSTENHGDFQNLHDLMLRLPRHH